MSFVLVDQSTMTDLAYGGELTPEILAKIAFACQEQLNGPFADAWGGSYTVRVGKDAADVGPNDVGCFIRDTLDIPGAAAYHDRLPNGAPVAYFAREDNNSLTDGPESLSVDMSHELDETAADPGANRWADEAGDRTEKAIEAADQVQNTCYAASNGVSVTNFLYPSAFDPGAAPPYDHLGKLKAQDDYDFGYEIVRSITAEAHDLQAEPLAARKGAKTVSTRGTPRLTQRRRHTHSRARRRGLALPPNPNAS